MPLASHFSYHPSPESTTPTSSPPALREQAVGATTAGLRYLLTKAMLQTSSALNVFQYLLLKAEHASDQAGEDSSHENDDKAAADVFMDADMGGGSTAGGAGGDLARVRSHPVISRLKELSDLSDRLETDVEAKVPTLRRQMESLVKAAELMREGREDNADSDDDDDEQDNTASSDQEKDPSAGDAPNNPPAYGRDSDDDPSSSEDEDDDDDLLVDRSVATEAKFALRPSDLRRDSTRRQRRLAPPSAGEYGDDEDDGGRSDGRALAATVNALAQRSGTRKAKGKTSAKPEEVDDENDERLMEGLKMMEEDIGEDSADDEDGASGGGDDMDPELNDDPDDDDDAFYRKVSAKAIAKKARKKELHAVAPKYPTMDVEVEGERALGQYILKNRGLVAHKAKINRNPRVKKREQYRKALIRRKGAVRDIRTDEGHAYGGETTGVKTNISRSRKLGVKR